MWDDKKSLKLSIVITRLLAGVTAASVFCLPFLTDTYIKMRGMNRALFWNVTFSLYLCVPLVFAALILLDRMLARINANKVFVPQNVASIRFISWICIILGIISAICGIVFYLPFVFVSVAVGFCSLILRVIKNVFEKAVIIKNENDFTI